MIKKKLISLLDTFSLFGEGTDSFGGELEFESLNPFCLEIDSKCTSGLDIRVAAFIAGFSTPAGQITYSTHKT